jgi:hypothetical protein
MRLANVDDPARKVTTAEQFKATAFNGEHPRVGEHDFAGQSCQALAELRRPRATTGHEQRVKTTMSCTVSLAGPQFL